MPPMTKAKETVQQAGKKTRETLHRHGLILPGWIQALIWALGVVTFAVLTVKNSIPLLSSYFNEEYNVEIKTRIVLNEKFVPPQFVLNIPHHLREKDKALGRISDHLYNDSGADCEECRRLAEAGWDVWRTMTIARTSYMDVYNSLTAAFTRKLLTVENDFDALSGNNSEWNAAVVDAAMNFFIWKHGLDRYFKHESDSSEIAMLDWEYSNHTWNGTRVFDLLHNRVMQALCRRMELYFDYFWTPEDKKPPKKTCEDILIDNSVPVIIDEDSVWIPLPSNASVECRFTFILQQYDNNSMWVPEDGMDQIGSFWLYADPLYSYYSEIDYDNGYWWHTVASGNMTGGKWPFSTVHYSVAMRTKEERTDELKWCYNDASPKVCVQKCSKRWTIDRCGCVPFTFHNGDLHATHSFDELPYCTGRSYNICNPMAFNDTDRRTCFKECSNPCEYTAYNFDVINEAYFSNDGLGFTIGLRPITSDPVVQFSNMTKNGIEDIISQIGGVIGLTLGLSGLSLFTFVITCVDFSQKYYRNKKDRQNRKLTAASFFRLAVMNRLVMQATDKNDDEEGDQRNKYLSPDRMDSDQDGNLRKQIQALIKTELDRLKLELPTREQINVLKEEIDLMKEQMTAIRNNRLTTSF